MAYVTPTTVEIVPAAAAQVADSYRIVRIEIFMGKPENNIPAVFEITFSAGTIDSNGIFHHMDRETVQVTDQMEIYSLMSALPNAGETISTAVERTAFEYLLSQGHVPAGSVSA